MPLDADLNGQLKQLVTKPACSFKKRAISSHSVEPIERGGSGQRVMHGRMD
jgi:hypothetical protein